MEPGSMLQNRDQAYTYTVIQRYTTEKEYIVSMIQDNNGKCTPEEKDRIYES